MNELPIILDYIPLATRNNFILKKNEVSAHFTIAVRNYLNENFENCWTETYVIIQWPH